MKTKMIKSVIILGLLVIASSTYSQSCAWKKCNKELYGDSYDYRGQSTYGSLAPGDTMKVRVVLYASNVIRIFVCGEKQLGTIRYRIIKTSNEYKKVVDRIQTNTVEEPVYKLDDEGQPIPVLNEWEEQEIDEFGEPKFEVLEYKEVTKADTIWKIEKKLKEFVLFNSTSGIPFFESKIERSTSVTIEIIVPPSTSTTEGCVAVMVGRKFRNTDYKSFNSNR